MQDRRIQRVGAVANRAYRGTRLSSGDLERQEGIRRGEHLGFFFDEPLFTNGVCSNSISHFILRVA